MDRGDSDLRGVICSDALDRKAQDLTRFLISFSTRAHFCIANDGGRFMNHLIFQAIKKLNLRFIARKTSDLLQARIDLLLRDVQIVLAFIKLTLQRGDLMFALVDELAALIKILFALDETIFRRADLFHALFALVLHILLDLECLILCFDERFAAHVFRFALCIGDDRLCFFCGSLGATFLNLEHQEITDEEANDDRNCGYDDNLKHNSSFLFSWYKLVFWQ